MTQTTRINTDNDRYLNLRKIFKKLEIDFKKSFFFLCISPRNIGKSTAAWELAISECIEKGDKVAYVRTNKERGEYFRESFNAKYSGRYEMSAKMIYSLKWDEKKEKYVRDSEIGSVLNIMNETNFKSGFFDNYKMFFWDEFNDNLAGAGLFEKFISLLKSVKRNKEPFYIILMGNKVEIGNDILQNLEIDLVNPDISQIEIRKGANPLYFVNIGQDEYPTANEKSDIVNQLAEYNENTQAYLNQGSYLSNISDMVTLYKKYIKPTATPKLNLAYFNYVIEYGTFGENQEKIYFHIVRQYNKNIPMLAINSQGFLSIQESYALWEQDDYIDLADFWKEKRKQGQLFYSTYECLNVLERFIITFSNFYESE